MTRTGILIVEDEGIVARDIERQLLGLGYQPVAIAMTGEEAVVLAESLNPRLALMDIHIAGAMDGIDAAIAIRTRFAIPSIFLTAYATDQVVERAKAAEPLGYIIKPFDEHSLRTTIEIALHKDQVDRQLRNSESRYRAVVQSAHDAVVTTNSAGTIVDWNPSAAAILGYAEAEVLGQPIAMLMPELDRERRLAEMRAASAEGTDGDFSRVRKVAFLNKDGRERLGELSLARWETAEGWFITGMFRDISERKRNEERLRIASAVVSNSPAVLFRWRAEEGWPVTYVSENIERQFGYIADDLVSGCVPFSRLVHPDDRARIAREVDEHSARGVTRFTQEYRVITKGGDTRWVDDRTVVERSADGRVLWYEGVLQDITEQKQADATRRLQSAALNAAANAIVITNRDGIIQWVNPAFTALTGYSRAEAVGRNPRELVKSGVHPQSFYEQMWHTLTAGAVWEGEVTNRRKDGTLYVEEQTITPVKDTAGAITHFVGVKRDMTEQRRLREQLTQAQKMEVVGRLAGGIAHDFNNLLTVINGTADLVLMDLPDGHPLREEFEHIQEAGNRAAQLTRQLLAFSRKQVLSPVALNLSTYVTNTTRMLQRLIGEDITLVIDTAPELATVLADPGQIEQVILNLAVNARDAMPGGGRLTIATRNVMLDEAFVAAHPDATAGPHVMMAVTDTGSGMPPEVLSLVFEPFFTMKGQGKGTGLGLATVYGIVRQSHGCVLVSSTPGEGTAFQVYLPVATAAVPATVVAPTDRPLRGTETILLAEDEDGLRALVTRMLQSSGYHVVATRSGEEALERLKSHDGPMALLFTDVVMTGISGLELARAAQAERPGLRVLFSSGYSDDRVSKKAANDARYFIAKPYTVQALAKKVREVLDEPAAAAGPTPE